MSNLNIPDHSRVPRIRRGVISDHKGTPDQKRVYLGSKKGYILPKKRKVSKQRERKRERRERERESERQREKRERKEREKRERERERERETAGRGALPGQEEGFVLGVIAGGAQVDDRNVFGEFG